MDLKKDLDEYLLLNEEKKSPNYKIDLGIPEIIKGNSLFGWFKKSSTESQTSNSWLETKESSCCPKLSRLQKFIGFVICLCLGTFCIVVSTFYIPVLLFKARKFGLLYSMGSAFFVASLVFLSGFKPLCDQLFSKPRLPISIVYIVSLISTLYFSMIVQSTLLTVCSTAVQIVSLVFLVLKSISGGGAGLSFFGSLFKKSVSSNLPI